jgi:serine-threonine kinase receptor-associated protein
MRKPGIVRTMETDKIVTSIEVMPDSGYVVTADGTEVKFWDGASLGMKKAYSQVKILSLHMTSHAGKPCY